jgi:hypothetical protein
MRSDSCIRALTSFAAFAGLFAIAHPEAAARPERKGGAAPAFQGQGRLRNLAQGMCLDVAGWAAQGDANVRLWECNDDPDQVWSFGDKNELHNVLTDQTLDPAGSSGAEGADVRIFQAERVADQRWQVVPRRPGMFEIRNAKRDMCLDVHGRVGARGDDVLLWTCDGGRDQLWTWEPYPHPPTGGMKLAQKTGAVSSTSGNSSASPFSPSRTTEKPAR